MNEPTMEQIMTAVKPARPRHETPPEKKRGTNKTPKKEKPVVLVPHYSLDGAIRQHEVPDMWRQIWDKIFTEGVHVHLTYRDAADDKIIHCWNAHPRSLCHERVNRVCLGALDPHSNEYRNGAGQPIAEWIPFTETDNQVVVEKLQEHFNG